MNRQIRVEGNAAFVPLTQGYEAVIDLADLPIVQGSLWHALVQRRTDGSIRAVYAARKVPREDGSRQVVLMHRAIAGTPPEKETDHRDGDGLNNRRSNLRDATSGQNRHNQRTRTDNTSGAKGVSWDRATRKWKAQIAVNGKSKSLGRYDRKTDARSAYASASAKVHGEFGRT